MPVMVARVCANGCGVPFRASIARVAAGRGIYCSKRCHSSANAKRNHQRYPQAGALNPNFKGWRSRDKRAYVDRFRVKYPEKALAHDAVKQALRSSRLVRPSACQQCGVVPVQESLHAHHDDYTKPMAVRFLCRACHLAIHAEQRAS